MVNRKQDRNRIFGTDLWATIVAYAFAFLLIVFATQSHAQTFTVLHAFGNGQDGFAPFAGLTMDAAGNLYGTTRYGGGSDNGTVFKLAPKGAGWLYSAIHVFNGSDGALPTAALVFGRDGILYGTTTFGGSGGEGTVFNLRPQPRACATALCPWVATVLHNFYGTDGFYPLNIAFDQAGNLYGVTADGGYSNAGVIFELTPSSGSWTFNMLSDFAGSQVSNPNGVIPDPDGNLYGSAFGPYPGVVFELTNAGEMQVLFNFTFSPETGIDPNSGLIFDNQGNLYGQTLFEGPGGAGGTVFELSPSNGSWTLNTLHGFPGIINNGAVAAPSLMMDAQGNIYGTTPWNGAHDYGEIFKLTPSGGGWTYTDLYDFTGASDGCYPWSNVVMDSKGNLYGTASSCGEYGQFGDGGVVWEITP
jgi:uncharacterized repeat protein (TIGR03803 family)